MSTLLRPMLTALALAAALYAALLALLWFGQERLLFRPRRCRPTTASRFEADVHEAGSRCPARD